MNFLKNIGILYIYREIMSWFSQGMVINYLELVNWILHLEVAERLGLKLGNLIIKKFEDSEINLQVLESIRGKDVFIIQVWF